MLNIMIPLCSTFSRDFVVCYNIVYVGVMNMHGEIM